MLPPTRTRVNQNTTKASNERIQALTECAVMKYAAAPPGEIEARLAELDREWDIERVLETNAAAFSLAGLLLGIAVSRKWLALPVTVAGFLLQHALQGWCPPVPVLRAVGVRTESEINSERTALKALRGDFSSVPGPQESRDTRTAQVLQAAGR